MNSPCYKCIVVGMCDRLCDKSKAYLKKKQKRCHDSYIMKVLKRRYRRRAKEDMDEQVSWWWLDK